MKKLILTGIIIFLFLIGNTVVAHTCKDQGKRRYESAERQLELVTHHQNLNWFNQEKSQKEPLFPVDSGNIDQQIAELNQILNDYQNVPECSSYYVNADQKIPKIKTYLEQLRTASNS